MTTSRLDEARAPASLAAVRVSCEYGALVAVRNVTLEVSAGTCVALVGESGSGKTTLLRTFNRLVSPTAGTVSVGGRDVRAANVEALRRNIGYVPQHGGLLPHWRVLRNVALVPSLLGDPDALDSAAAALALVGLSVQQFGDRFPHELSGGQRQRIALARALAARPGVILLDEPFGALDAITRAEVQGTFVAMRRTLGVTTLLVTHDLAEAARLADEIVVMRSGGIEQRGTFAELRNHPATAYVQSLLTSAVDSVAALVSA